MSNPALTFDASDDPPIFTVDPSERLGCRGVWDEKLVGQLVADARVGRGTPSGVVDSCD